MKIALVELNSHDYLNIYALIKMPRGIPLLAAILKQAGHNVTCYVESLQHFQLRELLNYDLVGFSTISCTANPTYQMIRKLRLAGYEGKIVVGGPHATVFPEESLEAGADLVVRHEGDKTLLQLVEAIEKKHDLEYVLGLSWIENGKIHHNFDQEHLTEEELSVLPFPALETIIGVDKIRHLSLTFSRGCPYSCDFCAVEAMFGKDYRFGSVDWRISQLRVFRDCYQEIWNNCALFIADDNFFGSHRGKEITMEMLKRMKTEELIPPKGWSCQMRVNDASSEIAKQMKQAGCTTACLGIESADAMTLKALNKNQSPEQIRVGLANLQNQGINTLAMTIAGTDTDTFWSFWRGVRQLREWGITYLQVLAMVPIAGTKMTRRFQQDGRVFSPNLDRYNGMHVLIKPKKMSRLGVWMGVYFVMFWFYFLNRHSLKLVKKHLGHYLRMMGIASLQGLKWSWQIIKERFAPQ